MRQFTVDFYWRMAHQDGKKPNEIMRYLEKSIDVDNKNALFHFSLGRAFLHKGLAEATQVGARNKWIRKSVDEFHKAIDLEPSKSDYHFHLGMSYRFLAYPPPFYWKVIQNSFRRTAMLNPTGIRHLYSIGIYYLNEYHRLKSIGLNTEQIGFFSYKKYTAMVNDNYQLYFRKLLDVNEEYLGKILKKSFSVTQRYSNLKAVIRDTPSDHAFLARFLNKEGMWEEAKKEFLAAINLEPTNSIHYSNFAYALFRKGDFEHAVYWWQKQKVLNPRDERPYLFSANGFIKLNQVDDALKELRDLITIYPENTNYQVKLIRIFLAARRLDEAIDEYYKIMGRNPNFSKDKYDRTRYFQRKGNYLKATKILNEALSSALNR
jgi:tetratricopeptide (TPR) repeat protein